jgi:hypothetical protein
MSIAIDYKQKYLKYKNKYLELKREIYGGTTVNTDISGLILKIETLRPPYNPNKPNTKLSLYDNYNNYGNYGTGEQITVFEVLGVLGYNMLTPTFFENKSFVVDKTNDGTFILDLTNGIPLLLLLLLDKDRYRYIEILKKYRNINILDKYKKKYLCTPIKPEFVKPQYGNQEEFYKVTEFKQPPPKR